MNSKLRTANKLVSVLVFCSLSLGANGAEPTKELPSPPPQTSSEIFKSILGDAKRKGLITKKSVTPEQVEKKPVESSTITSNTNSPNATINCSDLAVLELSALDLVESYTYLDITSADDSDPELTKARRYLALGLGIEARNLVSGRDDIQSKVVTRAGAALDGIPGGNLKAYSHCGIKGELWGLLGDTSFVIPERSDADLRLITDHLREMPPKLMEIIAIQYAISAIRSEKPRNARAVWKLLEDTASLAGKPLPDSRAGDHSLMFLRAMLNEKMEPELSRSLYEYLAVRDSIYALQSIERLQDIKKAHRNNNDHGLASSEADLKSIAHQYSDQSLGREANVFLIDLEVQSGNLINAIKMTREMFTLEDDEFLKAANSVGSKLLIKLKNPSIAEKLSALNVYFSDRAFFDSSELRSDLLNSAGPAAVQIGYPELAQMVYAGNESLYASKISEAKARQDLKNGKIASTEQFPMEQDLIKFAINQALAAGDTETARKFLTQIQDPVERQSYEAVISWIDRAWVSLSEAKNAIPVIGLLSSSQISGLTESEVNSEAINLIIRKMDSDLAVGMEYLRNG